MRATWLLGCATSLAISASAAAQDPPPVSRVRPEGENARQLIAAALETSPSVSRLVADLDAKDVIVLVTVAPSLDLAAQRCHANMRLVGSGHGQRFATIWIDERQAPVSAIALLAHELWHVWELANAPWVMTQAQMYQLFSQIGREHRPNRFETEGAVDAEHAARREALAYRSATSRPRRPKQG